MRKKKRTGKRRAHSGLSAPARRKRSHRRRSGGLGDIFNPTVAMNSAKKVGAGAIGGFGAMVVNKSILPSDSGKLVKLGVALGGGFLLGAFGFDGMGAGFTGGMVATAFPNGLLGDDDNANFADEGSLNDAPIFLDEDDQPMMLHEDDNGAMTWRYLSDDEMAEFEEMQDNDNNTML